jgi:hypothetical protein
MSPRSIPLALSLLAVALGAQGCLAVAAGGAVVGAAGAVVGTGAKVVVATGKAVIRATARRTGKSRGTDGGMFAPYPSR